MKSTPISCRRILSQRDFTYLSRRLVLLFILGLVGLFCSCGDPVSRLERKIESYWHENCSANKECLLRFQDLTDIDWDRMYVFGAYTSAETIRDALGINTFVDLEFTRKIVLMKGNSLTYAEQTPSNMENYIDGEAVFAWEDGVPFGFYRREEAWFIVQRIPLDSNGGHYFTLRKYK